MQNKSNEKEMQIYIFVYNNGQKKIHFFSKFRKIWKVVIFASLSVQLHRCPLTLASLHNKLTQIKDN